MGILNRLWASVWKNEEAEKVRRKNAKIIEVVKKIEKRYAKPTPVQAACLKQGGPEMEDTYPFQSGIHGSHILGGTSGGSSANVNPSTYRQMLLMSQAQANALTNQQALVNSAMMGQAPGNVLTGGAGGSAILGSPIYTTFPHTYPMGAVVSPKGNYDSHEHNVFFMALRGIEQASMKKPEGNHRYDDLALGIQDLRNFNEMEISLIGLTSFCLSNVMEVEPIAMLLEGYGLKVV